MPKIVAFIVLCFIFVPLERIFSLRRDQPIFRNGWKTDVVHFFVNNLLVQIGLVVLLGLVLLGIDAVTPAALRQTVSAQPWWLQFVEALAIAELMAYVGHRLVHTVPFLWRFHAVHHSIEEMDWLASARVHPLDQVFIRSLQIVPLYVLGFSKATFGAFAAFAVLHALFLHANVRFRFGPLEYVIGTPAYHHWHHANDPDAMNKNFAGQLPLIDLLFGTFYLPKDRQPETFGCDDPVPKGHYLRQLAFPFRRGDSQEEGPPESASATHEGVEPDDEHAAASAADA